MMSIAITNLRQLLGDIKFGHKLAKLTPNWPMLISSMKQNLHKTDPKSPEFDLSRANLATFLPKPDILV